MREDIRGDGGYQMLRICEKEFLPKFPCGYTRVIGRGGFHIFWGSKVSWGTSLSLPMQEYMVMGTTMLLLVTLMTRFLEFPNAEALDAFCYKGLRQ